VGSAVRAALHDAADAGARILAVGAAVFTLAATGLLDGHRVACHGRAADRLIRRYSRVRVVPGVRYVDDDPFLTAAGATAGLDLCLHLVRKDHGASAAELIRPDAVALFVQDDLPKTVAQPPDRSDARGGRFPVRDFRCTAAPSLP